MNRDSSCNENRIADVIAKLAETPQVVTGTSKDGGKTTIKIKEFTTYLVVTASTISSDKPTIGEKLGYNERIDKDKKTAVASSQF